MSSTWQNVLAAENVLCAVKWKHKEKEMAWAKVCIERGEVLLKKSPDFEVLNKDEEWEYTCFVKDFNKRAEVFLPNGKIDIEIDAWARWRLIAAHEGWLLQLQKVLVMEQEQAHGC